jgi:YD repeat-containing protein
VKRQPVRRLAAILGFIVGLKASAQQQPNLEKGFHADKVYSSADLDHVNLFNGSLNIVIPLGQRYRVSSALDYGFSLVYAANNWDTQYGSTTVFEQCPGQPVGNMCYDQKQQNYTSPYRRSSAGLGWTLSLGRLYVPDDPSAKCSLCATYQSPDGGEHAFYPKLHGADPGTPNASYTNDNTYLRLRNDGTQYYVDFPNGNTYTFDETTGALKTMSDAFGNSVDITPAVVASPDSSSCGTGNVKQWDVHDSTGRHQYFYFRQDLQPYTADGIACRADLAAFNGTRAVYSLNYTVKTISRQFVFTEVDNPAEVGNAVSVPLLTRIDLPGSAGSYTAVYDIGCKLNGSTVTGLTSDDTDVPDRLSDVTEGLNPGSFTGEIMSLRLPTRATIRWTRQQYALALKPPPGPLYPSPTGALAYTNRVSGVKTRSVEVDGVTAVWNYTSLAVSPTVSVTTVTEPVTQTRTSTYFSICEDCNSPPAVPAEYGLPVYRSATAPRVTSGTQGPYTLSSMPSLGIRMNNVTTIFDLTAGSQTVNQIVNALNLNNSFNTTFYAENINNTLSIRTAANGGGVSFQIDGSIANSAHAALGLDTNVHSGTTDNVEDGHYLSSEVTDSSGNLLKRTYVSYETDPVPAFCPCGFGAYDLNRRISGETVLTMNPDHPGTPDRAITNYSDFDGFGHYRTTTINGNFPGENARTTTTKYNQSDSDVDSNGYNSTSGSGLALPSNGKWVLDTYSSIVTTNAAGVSSKVNDWFDATSGFLQRQRILASGTTQQNNDTITRFTQTGGNVTREEYFGGDPTPSSMLESGETPAAGLDTSSSLSTISLGSPRYQIDHVYDRGVLKSSKYFDAGAGAAMPFYSVFRIIDPSTGLPSSEFDPAGSSTAYSYDLLGRMTTATPPAGLTPTTITYTDATTTANASVDVSTSPTASHVDYDALGRVRLEWTRERNGNWSVVSTEYDGAGRKSRVSTPMEATAIGAPPTFSNFTTYTYDSLGRVVRVTAPDGKYVDTSYQGAQSLKRTIKIQTSAGGTSDAVTTETYDRQGRLYRVDEPIGTSTTYSYDVGSHISQVAMTSGSTQLRTFSYDNRGFLTQETHPESGTTTWSYDPRGHPLTKFIAAGSRYNMRYSYDAAERLTLVRSRGDWLVNPPWFVSAKEFTYSTANSGANLTLGKLETALRHNWAASGSDVTVKETYTYAGNGGSLTGKTTEIDRIATPGATAVLLQKFSQGYDRDALGLLKTITYPACADVARPCGDSTWDSISQQFTVGRLTAIAGSRGYTSFPFVTDVTYSVNGMPNQITHSNSMLDVQTPDSSGMARPLSIEFRGYSSCIAPSISTPPQNVTIGSGQTAALDITAYGTAALTYEWFDLTSSTPLSSSSQSGFTTPPLTQNHQYYVMVYNACGRVSTQATPVQVTVSSCTTPSITSGPSFTPPAYNQPTTISIAASAAGLHYAWYQGDAPSTAVPVGTDWSTFTTPALTATRHYWVRVSNTCGSVNSTTAIVTVSLAAPAGLTATWNSSNAISIQWAASVGADHYIVERRSGGGFLPAGSPAGTSLSDASLAADTTYIYRVRSADATGESVSPYSNYDLATTTAMNSLSTIAFVDLDQIRLLVNRIRGAAGLGALSWTDIMSGYTTPVPRIGEFVYANHILVLRTRMNEALGAAGVATPAYTTNVAVGAPITAAIWTELRGRAQ